MATLLGRRALLFRGAGLQPHGHLQLHGERLLVLRSFRGLSTATDSDTTSAAGPNTTTNAPTDRVSPRLDPCFRYGDVIIINDGKGDRRLMGPLQKGASRDSNFGRLKHDDIIGLTSLSTIKTHKGAKYTLHWPTLDEYCTKAKRQATIMYPKDATTAVHLLDLFPGAHVLEAGTGNGSMSLYIQRAIQGPGSHLDTVDIRKEHSLQAEQNIERFWRGMYRSGITFWRSEGGLQRVIKHLKGEDGEAATVSISETVTRAKEQETPENHDVDRKQVSLLEAKRAKQKSIEDYLPPNPHPKGHQYDAISLDLPDCKDVLIDLLPLLKPDRPMCLYMVNMSQVLELVQWMRTRCNGYTVEKVLEVGWKEWSVRSAAVRSKVNGRVHVGGLGKVSVVHNDEGSTGDNATGAGTLTTASDNIPDDAVGWICRPLHMPIGHTGFLVQLRKNSANP
ncbi:S-adenosyl-L-methionine-dependent methyltransferase [Mortierella sp. GBAus27b]|nr:hypothetical protein BGX31_009901 [Mortierella sp. GBA43]KAI8346619.1 S-adenosyl-L-methionine-dependent methyltransferase [Mortierella sp. GBAus27b]